ncbi:MAG: hypothetical protein ACK5MW_00295 [Enterococcus sp.]
MVFILTTLLVFVVSIRLASLLSAFLLVFFFHLKRLIFKMDEEKWGTYFQSIGQRGILFRTYSCFFIALAGIAVIDTILFWRQCFVYGVVLLFAGGFHLFYRYQQNKAHFWSQFHS